MCWFVGIQKCKGSICAAILRFFQFIFPKSSKNNMQLKDEPRTATYTRNIMGQPQDTYASIFYL